MRTTTLRGAALLATALGLAACHPGPRPSSAPEPSASPGDERSPPPPEPAPASARPRPEEALERLLGARPARLSLAFAIDAERGCSQSFASETVQGTLTLELEGSGEARLVVEADERILSGPSLGRFREGDRDFSQVSRALRRACRGLGQARRGELSVLFREVELAEAEVLGPSPPPLAEPTARRAVSTLSCVAGRLPAYPPAEGGAPPLVTEGQVAEDLPVLLCRASEPLFPLEREVQLDGAFPLARAPGLVAAARTSDHGDALVYRRGPAPPAP